MQYWGMTLNTDCKCSPIGHFHISVIGLHLQSVFKVTVTSAVCLFSLLASVKCLLTLVSFKVIPHIALHIPTAHNFTRD